MRVSSCFVFSGRFVLLLAAVALALLGCSPTFNWRQVQGSDAPFSVLLPAKPSTFSRPVNLDGIEVTMTMTATEVEGAVYAIGSAKLSDVTQAKTALAALKTALIRNINGTVKSESVSAAQDNLRKIDIEALGPAENGHQARVLFAHLEARGQYIYQVIVVGPQEAVSHENIVTFLQSFQAR